MNPVSVPVGSNTQPALRHTPKLPERPLRGTAAIIEYARARGFFDKRAITGSFKGMLPELMRFTTTFLPASNVQALIQTAGGFVDVRVPLIQKRDDVAQSLLDSVQGDVSQLSTKDYETLKGIGPSIRSIRLRDFWSSLEPSHIAAVVRLMPKLTSVEMMMTTPEHAQELLPLKDTLHTFSLEVDPDSEMDEEVVATVLAALLPHFTELRELKLFFVDVSKLLPHLSAFKHLISLRLARPAGWTNQSLQMVATGVPNLRVLALDIYEGEIYLALDLFRKLEELDLGNSRITDAALEKLSKLTHLSRLKLNLKNCTDAGFVHLRRLSLESACLAGLSAAISAEAMDGFLTAQKNLKKFDIGGGEVGFDAAKLRKLPDCKELTELSFFQITNLEGNQPACIQGLNLAELTFNFAAIGKTVLEALSHMTRLQTVGFWHTNIDMSELGNDWSLPHLRKLAVRGSSDNLVPIARLLPACPDLKELSYSFEGTTDQTFEDIAGAASLQDLEIHCDNQISAKGIKALQRLRKLEKLELDGLDMQDEGVVKATEALRASLPTTRITIEPFVEGSSDSGSDDD